MTSIEWDPKARDFLKKLPKVLFIFVLLISLFPLFSYIALADCSEAADIILQCHNKTDEQLYCIGEQDNVCSILIDVPHETKDGIEVEEKTVQISFDTYTEQEGAQIIPWVEQFCVEDIEAIKPLLDEYIKKHEVYVVDDTLFFVPYSEERMTYIEKRKNDFIVCEYNQGEKVGDWILLTPKVKWYCYPDLHDSVECFTTYVSVFENKIILFFIGIITVGVGFFIALYIKKKKVGNDIMKIV